MKAAAADVAERLQRALQRARLRVDARWVPEANLHVTLWFIGEVDEEGAANISEALQVPLAVSPFTLTAAGIGAFPASGPLRVLWIGIRSGTDALTKMHADLTRRFSLVGLEGEQRPYSAHLTIARVKDVRRSDVSRVRQLLTRIPADAGSTTITSATLFRSRVSSKGSTYEPLLRIRLA